MPFEFEIPIHQQQKSLNYPCKYALWWGYCFCLTTWFNNLLFVSAFVSLCVGFLLCSVPHSRISCWCDIIDQITKHILYLYRIHVYRHKTRVFEFVMHRATTLLIYTKKTKTKIQGELVDSVEHHVESSTDYIKQGHLELKQAEVYQSKARKVQFQLECQLMDIL